MEGKRRVAFSHSNGRITSMDDPYGDNQPSSDVSQNTKSTTSLFDKDRESTGSNTPPTPTPGLERLAILPTANPSPRANGTLSSTDAPAPKIGDEKRASSVARSSAVVDDGDIFPSTPKQALRRKPSRMRRIPLSLQDQIAQLIKPESPAECSTKPTNSAASGSRFQEQLDDHDGSDEQESPVIEDPSPASKQHKRKSPLEEIKEVEEKSKRRTKAVEERKRGRNWRANLLHPFKFAQRKPQQQLELRLASDGKCRIMATNIWRMLKSVFTFSEPEPFLSLNGVSQDNYELEEFPSRPGTPKTQGRRSRKSSAATSKRRNGTDRGSSAVPGPSSEKKQARDEYREYLAMLAECESASTVRTPPPREPASRKGKERAVREPSVESENPDEDAEAEAEAEAGPSSRRKPPRSGTWFSGKL
ncbi:hypothetical protein F4677DRAFT_695 [Hypoxylon crocopeplum]|nr:hypothetical protein F4677DRAFT_695 [Hypoxylon crocopeplum]